MRALKASTVSKSDTIAAYRAQLADSPEQQAVDRLEQQIQALRQVFPIWPSLPMHVTGIYWCNRCHQ